MDFDSGCSNLNQKITNWLEWDKVFIIIDMLINERLINI